MLGLSDYVLLFGRWPKMLLRHVRPITIVSVFSRGFERLINGQVLAHVDRLGLLSRVSIWVQVWSKKIYDDLNA
jgi:hypothetical protein